MSGWQSARDLNADVAPCQRCGKDVVLDYDPPCPDGYVACPECGHEAVCRDCRHRAELQEWVANIGPPHDLQPDAPTSVDVAEWLNEINENAAARGYDPTTNSYRRKA